MSPQFNNFFLIVVSVVYVGYRAPLEMKQGWPDAFENMLKNSQHLVTPLDVHSTLASLLEFKSLNYTSNPHPEPLMPSPALFGRSIFQKAFFEKGNCYNLGIADEFCSCHEHQPAEMTGDDEDEGVWLTEYGRGLVGMINGLAREEMKVFEKTSLQSEIVQYLDMCRPWVFSRIALASRYGEILRMMVRSTSIFFHNRRSCYAFTFHQSLNFCIVA
jgi:hypothetical protein